MHFVIMGSGRVGAAIATALDKQGHSVAIIDQTSDAFRKLPSDFNGQKIKGLGFDRDILEKANIGEAYAFAAVSNGDNSNILAARIARENFGVKRVVARIYDPRRAELYQQLGIPTTSPVRWSSEEILSQMLPNDSQTVYFDSQFGTHLLRVEPTDDWLGVSIQAVQRLLDIKVAYIGRNATPLFNLGEQVIQEHDQLFCAVATDRVTEVKRAFTRPPELTE